MRRSIHRVLPAAATVLLAGCEHATGLQEAVRPRPEQPFGQAAAALAPHELAPLMDMAHRVERQSSQPSPLPRMGHPLDGLSEAQIKELFSVAGLSPEPYLPAGFEFCQAGCAKSSAP